MSTNIRTTTSYYQDEQHIRIAIGVFLFFTVMGIAIGVSVYFSQKKEKEFDELVKKQNEKNQPNNDNQEDVPKKEQYQKLLNF
jgi:hypothetical protein